MEYEGEEVGALTQFVSVPDKPCKDESEDNWNILELFCQIVVQYFIPDT